MKSQQFWDWFDSFAAPKLAEWPQMNRAATFRKMFEHLDSIQGRPVHIVETGCIEEPDNWKGNGCSTILFDEYVKWHPASTCRSVEIDPDKVAKAKKICPRVWFFCGDSVEFLGDYGVWNHGVDLLYLDASNHNWINESPSQMHHLRELLAVMPRLHDQSMVAVDDSIVAIDEYPQTRVFGKGALVAQYAYEVAADLEFTGYQIGFTGINKPAPKDVFDLEPIILRAREHVEAGRRAAADQLYRLVLMCTPQPWNGKARIARGEACANFARNCHIVKKHGMAIDWYHDSLNADPLCVDYRVEMARSMVALGALSIARREASIATNVEPDNPLAWQVLGGVESDMMNEEATIEAYDKALELCMEGKADVIALSDNMLNRATIALDTRDYDRVRKLCETLIKLKVREGDAWHLMAMLEYRLSNHELSIELFEKAEAANCRKQPLMHWNKHHPLHAIGKLKEGWIEHAWAAKEMEVHTLYIPHHRFNKPQWRGEEPAHGAASITIHVHTEAGHGDNISLLRYLPMLVERGFTVNYECDPALTSLVRHSMPMINVMDRAKNYPGVIGLKEFDYHIPIGDLPHVFGTDIGSVPWNGPYLKADPELSKQFAGRLKGERRCKIGLCWSSGIRREMNIWMEKYGRMKSMDFSDLRPITYPVAHTRNEALVSLQIGDGRSDMTDIIDLLSEEPAWDETAALIDNLDLVITVDTGVAHLAGAMGKPVWVMMQRDGASWHFMCYRDGASWNESSPWYPTARLFRQHEFNTPGYWKDVVDDVAGALSEQGKAGADLSFSERKMGTC